MRPKDTFTWHPYEQYCQVLSKMRSGYTCKLYITAIKYTILFYFAGRAIEAQVYA
jgi:hypothetical protein